MPSRAHTTTARTDGTSATAASAIAFIATGRPRRGTASAVSNATAPASASRAATAGAAKPEKIGTTIAPILAIAKNPATTWIDIGR